MVEEFLKRVRIANQNEPEFLQAVEEFVRSVWSLYESEPKYQEAKILEQLLVPDRIFGFKVSWKTDNGELTLNKGYRIQFSNTLGQYKGGLRFHPSVNLSILKFLGFEQIFKNALTGLPLGGAKGGSDFDPKGKSEAEIERFCRAFTQKLAPYIGYDFDVPAGDIGVGGREIKYMLDEYLSIRKVGPSGASRNMDQATFTGKALADKGSNIRTEATGYGLLYFVEEMLKVHGETIADKRVLVSGSGNVAQYAVEKAIQMGAKVITISDSDGFILDEDGFNQDKIDFVKELKNIHRDRISEYVIRHKRARYIPNKKPWKVRADIALPCATQNEIIQKDAEELVANGIKLVAEGANMPSEKLAIDVFLKAGVLFGPAKATNAGGVAVSGLEMEQNAKGEQWSRGDVDAKLREIMRHIHEECVKYGGGNYLDGANIAGFKRVADAMVAK
ncbi:MAG TPA: NADP-specific glutamate dehydrogenase [Candidatus Paceibacterota bacterium]